MFRTILKAAVVALATAAGMTAAGAAQEPRPDEKKLRSGTVVGVLTDKRPAGGGVLIRADGEDAARRYWKFGNKKDLLQQIEATPVGSRVRVKWEAPGNEGPHVAAIELLGGPVAQPSGPVTLEATLAWVKRVDGELVKPRYADLTADRLKALTDLQLGGHRKSDKKHLFVEPAEFRFLAPLTGLTKLHLGENDGATDEALAHVGKLSGLKVLILWDAPVTDAGLKHLAGLRELTDLDLAFATKLTTAALPHVVALPKLERLNLAGTKVDDVSALTAARALTELKLGKLKPAGVEAITKANPRLVVK
jgi:hypothetical protein